MGRFFRAMATAFVLLSLGTAFGQQTAQQDYIVSVGDPANTVSSGIIWLYSYSWGGLQRLQLATIRNGAAVVPLDVDRIQHDLDHPNAEGYVIAVQIGEHEWFRTADIASNALWARLGDAVDSLGRVSKTSEGRTQLVLPAPAARHITMLYLDGRPAADADIAVSVYLWDSNHCGFHEGLPLGTLHTDKTGTLAVSAPLVPLYLDGIRYYHPEGRGPAGTAYSSNFGLKTSAEANLVLNEGWQLKDSDSLNEADEIRVVTAGGQPRPGLQVTGNWSTNTCGGGDRVGQTDSGGVAKITLDPSYTNLALSVGYPLDDDMLNSPSKYRELTDSELRELFSKHTLTIRW